ncbi:myoneurin-like isoform X2 [Palaemon carinicauda]|uniref:myoneurin-like isoform X2 n=1 Tax=Palaemon carinicauda TaxID=392227 RepID=UPI0035B68032
MEYYAQQKQSLHNFHFGCDGEEKFFEIQQYLRRLSEANENSSCQEVIFLLENERLAVNATVLSALSPYWRGLVNSNTQDSPIVYKISPVLSSGTCGFLPLIKLLIYNGLVSVSVLYIKDVMAILRELHLEATNFILSNTGNEVETLTWENHFEVLMKGIQIMCNKQQCADLSIFVESHVIKVHRLILSSYSEVLDALFQENNKIRTLHLPGISLKSAQTLIGYMYYGKGILPPAYIEDFSKLCKCMKVKRLANKLQMHQFETKIKDKPVYEKQGNVFITSEPEIALVLKRLVLLFDVKHKTDLTLVTGNKRIYTHKSLLGMTCPSFHTVLMEEPSNEQSAILLADADPISVTAVITLLYNGSCLITRSQMNSAASYLDSGLFKLHMSNEIPSEPDSKVIPFDTVDNSEDVILSSANKEVKPIKNNMEKHENVKVHPYSYRNSTEATAVIGVQSVEGQVDTMKSADTLPKKRPRKSKSYNCDEWVTEESELKAAIVGNYPTRSLIPEKSFPCRICDKIFSSQSSLNGHMKVHSDQSSPDSTVFKKCTSSVTRRTMYKSKKSIKRNQCKFCKRIFRRGRLEEHIKSKHSRKESDDVNEDKCLEYEGLSVSQNQPGDCSRMHENKEQHLVAYFSPQKYKDDLKKLSQDSILSWNRDSSDLQCSKNKKLLQHTSQEVCDATINHPSEPIKMINIDEYQLDKSNTFVCPECGEIFNELEKFSAHAEQKGHGGLQGSCWICGVCEAAFFEEDDLTKHLVSHNTDIEGVASSNGEKQPVTIFDQDICNEVNGRLTSVDVPNDASKNNYTLHDKVESD